MSKFLGQNIHRIKVLVSCVLAFLGYEKNNRSLRCKIYFTPPERVTNMSTLKAPRSPTIKKKPVFDFA